MKRTKKPVQIELDVDEWWSLSRYAAIEKRSMRQIAREQILPFIQELKKKYPREPNKDSAQSNEHGG